MILHLSGSKKEGVLQLEGIRYFIIIIDINYQDSKIFKIDGHNGFLKKYFAGIE